MGSALPWVPTQGFVGGETLGGRPQGFHDPRRRRLWLPSETRHAGAPRPLSHRPDDRGPFGGETFDELSKAHRVLQWLELGSLCVCWLTLHAGTVFFIGEKEGRISHESLTALSFYVVGGNLLFTLYLDGRVRPSGVPGEQNGWGRRAATEISGDRYEAGPSNKPECSTGEKGSVAKGQELAGERVGQRSHGG